MRPDFAGSIDRKADGSLIGTRHACGLLNYLRRPSRDTLLILERIDAMAVDFSGLTALLADYSAKVDAYVQAAEQHKADVKKAVDDAIAADDASEITALENIKAKIEAAAAKVPAPPVAPTFEPSNN